MKQDDIFPILQALQDPGPLDPNPANAEAAAEFKKLYIANLNAKQGDVAKNLNLEIRASTGARHAYLFSGTIGSGKSTELLRLAQKLRPDHFAVVMNAKNYLNTQSPIEIVDLLLAMALCVWETTAYELKLDLEAGQSWSSWKAIFKADVEPEGLELNLGIAKLKTGLHQNPDVRDRLRKYHRARLDTLVQEVNEFFDECASKLKAKLNLTSTAKMVLIVDSLEHFGGQAAAGDTDTVFTSLQHLFNDFASLLKIKGWSTLFSVPPLLQKLAPGIANTFGVAETYFLTSAHVFLDRTSDIDLDTVDNKLIPLVKQRIGVEIVSKLIADAQIRDIIVKTGGDLRDLLRTLRSALLVGLREENFPINQSLLNKVYDTLRRPYLPLTNDAKARLQHVHLHYEPNLDKQEDWNQIIADLAQKRILMYLNGTEWYGVHPLLVDYFKIKNASGSADTSN